MARRKRLAATVVAILDNEQTRTWFLEQFVASPRRQKKKKNANPSLDRVNIAVSLKLTSTEGMISARDVGTIELLALEIS